MKKFTMVLVLLALVGSAQAAVLFEDNFESYTPGTTPNDPTVGSWNFVYDGYDGTAVVTDSTAAVGSQVWRLLPILTGLIAELF